MMRKSNFLQKALIGCFLFSFICCPKLFSQDDILIVKFLQPFLNDAEEEYFINEYAAIGLMHLPLSDRFSVNEELYPQIVKDIRNKTFPVFHSDLESDLKWLKNTMKDVTLDKLMELWGKTSNEKLKSLISCVLFWTKDIKVFDYLVNRFVKDSKSFYLDGDARLLTRISFINHPYVINQINQARRKADFKYTEKLLLKWQLKSLLYTTIDKELIEKLPDTFFEKYIEMNFGAMLALPSTVTDKISFYIPDKETLLKKNQIEMSNLVYTDDKKVCLFYSSSRAGEFFRVYTRENGKWEFAGQSPPKWVDLSQWLYRDIKVEELEDR